MSEPILMALVQLFAIVAAAEKKGVTEKARETLFSYLQRHLNSVEQEEYIKLFDELLFFHQPDDDTETPPEVIIGKIRPIGEKVNRELRQRDKIIVFLKFIEFIQESYSENEPQKFIHGKKPFIYFEALSAIFNFSEKELSAITDFIFSFDDYSDREDIIAISGGDEEGTVKKIRRELLDGKILLLHLDSLQTFIGRYYGNDTLFLNGHLIHPKRSFFFDNGDILKSQKIQPVYYSDLVRFFLGSKEQVHIEFTVKDVEYHFRNSTNGIQQFSFTAESGELIGVMGGSGVGKSTLLNLLNGNIKPQKGNITINGYDIHNDQRLLKGSIGFVPQDDLLIEELTVYQNLYYNAKLCFDRLPEEKLHEVVRKTLSAIDLLENSHLKVGDPLNKTISGGQRKRLNIALELIRQPSILFADEPTSGLSSMDSEMVMTLLKEQTLHGKLIFVNIHQPSSDIFRLFDKLLIMDKGGYPVYYGNPIEALSYFKKIANYVNPDESECMTCGYINPEQILQIIESRLVSESGKVIPERKITSREWYDHFRKKIQPTLTVSDKKGLIPCCFLSVPGKLKQFFIFSRRNLQTKISNRQYMMITLLEAPVLAALLAFLTRYKSGSEYIFGDNRNIVAFLFMSVVVSLFLGMMVSAEEIIRDRKLLKREAFLHLSRFSYLNSKIVFLFFLSAIQSLLYVFVGNLILGIHGMMFSYWLILFSTSCVANMIGLNISAAMNSVVAIYITIPFIIVPQLLLSGTVVSFDNLNPAISSREHVPLIGDVMPSRWSFEALAVEQFSNNEYEKMFYPYDQKVSTYSYITAYQIPYLTSALDECARELQVGKDYRIIRRKTDLVENEISKLAPSPLERASSGDYSSMIGRLRSDLDSLTKYYSAKLQSATAKRDRFYESVVSSLGEEGIQKIREDNYNENLADLALNTTAENKILEIKGRLVRKKDPVFAIPEFSNGKAQLYSPVKVAGSLAIDTFWFNTIVLWFMSGLLYIILVTGIPDKLTSSVKIPIKIRLISTKKK